MRIRRLTWAFAAAAAAFFGTQVYSGCGYLPVGGPAPLRLQLAPSGPAPPLPPLRMDDAASGSGPNKDEASATTAPELTGPGTATPANHTSTTRQALNSAQGPTPWTNSVPLRASDISSAPAISPQMLIHFFSDAGGTNRGTSAILPVQFSPAMPAAAPSSRASYTSNPTP